MFVPGTLKSEMCGLCGNFNDNKEDEWIVGAGCEDKGVGSVVSEKIKGVTVL